MPQNSFLPKRNGLDLVRLLLAGSVLFWHSFQLTGWGDVWGPMRQIFANVGVDGFFAISGYLILNSREHRGAWPFAKARLLRIFPALIVCLAMTAFIFAPFFSGYSFGAGLAYFGLNLAMLSRLDDALRIGNTLSQNVNPGVWNLSLWTLRFELLYYAMVLVIARRGRPTFLPLIWSLWAFGWLTLASKFWFGQEWLYGLQAPILGRTLLMFCSGMLIYKYRERITANRTWMLASALIVLLAASFNAVSWGWSFSQSYQLLAALPLAYLVLSIGAKLCADRWVLTGDYSYGVYIYGFVAQQLFIAWATAMWGQGWLHTQSLAVFGTFGASAVLTFAFAWLSWHLIEKPALRLKN